MTTATTIQVFVELGKNEQRKLEFHQDEVTGQQIKEAAGVPLDDDLAVKRGHNLELVTNGETVTIRNGEHFVALPPGSIS